MISSNVSSQPLSMYDRASATLAVIEDKIKTIVMPIFLAFYETFSLLKHRFDVQVSSSVIVGLGLVMTGIFLKLLVDQSRREAQLKEDIRALNQDLVHQHLESKELNESHQQSLKKLKEAIQCMTEKEPINGQVYQVCPLELEDGSIQSIFPGYSEKDGPVAIAKNSNSDYHLGGELIELWNECFPENPILNWAVKGKLQVLVQKWNNAGTLSQFQDNPTRTLSDKNWVILGGDLLRFYLTLHRRALIHGDAKPANLMFHDNGERVMIRLIDLNLLQSTIKPEIKMGAHTYRAPELIWNENQEGFSTIDHAKAEVYAVGLVLAQMWSGKAALSQQLLDLIKDFQTKLEETKELLFSAIVRQHIKKSKKIKTVEFQDLCELYNSWRCEIQLKPPFQKFKPLIDRMLQPDPANRCTIEEAYDLFKRVEDKAGSLL